MKGLSEFAKSFFDAVFPPICLVCEKILQKDERELSLCRSCREKFSYPYGFFCPICKRRLPSREVTCHGSAKFVLASPLKFEESATQKLIHVLKYDGVKKAAVPLAFFTTGYLLKTFLNSGKPIEGDFTMIPVPLHPSKERRRGFNQSLLIARNLKRFIGEMDAGGAFPKFEIEENILVKSRKAKSQTEQKSYKERRENVKGSFSVRRGAEIAGRNFFVVDDVFTSGATITEITALLKKNGARKIIAITAART